MGEKINLKEIEKKSWRYSEQDGLTEVSLGLLLVGVGILRSIGGLWGGVVTGVYSVLFVVVIIRVLEIVRREFTYPRVGRVKVLRDSPKKTVMGIFTYGFIVAALMAVAVFVVFGEISADVIYRSTPIFLAIMILGGMAYAHGKSGSRRYYVYAAIALAAAPSFSLIDFGARMAGLGYYLLFMGSLFIAIGLAIFVRFLQKYPKVKRREAQ